MSSAAWATDSRYAEARLATHSAAIFLTAACGCFASAAQSTASITIAGFTENYAACSRTDYRGMRIAILAAVWDAFDTMPPARLARTLRSIAANLDPRTIRKHPRGPKPRLKLGYAPKAQVQRHVATARVLRDGKIR